MAQHSEQDLRYAAELREGVHREALAIIRKTHPNVTEVIDRHPVEDYFQELWDYPGQWYPVVAIPGGYAGRKALVEAIVRDTLSGLASDAERAPENSLAAQPRERTPERDPFFLLLDEYPGLAVDYCILENGQRYQGQESHRKALEAACGTLCEGWDGDAALAAGKQIPADALFSPDCRSGTLNYRKAFLYPPHGSGCTDRDFSRVNAALFPKGTDALEAYEWTTDWSAYFDDGHEWWGALCLTVYDKALDRFVVILASATD